MNTPTSNGDGSTQGPDVVRWGVGCAVGAAALTGIAILVFLVSLALQPPTWVQVVLGVVLAVGAAVFAWLIVAAWRRSDRERGDEGSGRVSSRPRA